ncbi:DUF6547 family protein [Roseimicrobium sp. ORNL1]|uniref:DUF6547 family protein n=1 Tax=Roseimicrobium sp. ORNL1 TaxID=2711231 RepID=UPI0013E1AB84|nr:DUF6547 family protein [Roseimicrobium sp. ORNL1]QIF04890.1 hypothetical protein G5S37_26375 [Roseimicrobium sp. ORNL1]
MEKPAVYKQVIDHLVEECKSGQGQIGPARARQGVWNANATADFIPEQHKINVLLSELTEEQRDILAGVLEQQFSAGVFESLKALEIFAIKPFEDGYEGSPYNDFIGRLTLDDWAWPDESQR